MGSVADELLEPYPIRVSVHAKELPTKPRKDRELFPSASIPQHTPTNNNNSSRQFVIPPCNRHT